MLGYLSDKIYVDAMPFTFSDAIVCRVPESIRRGYGNSNMDVGKARDQHQAFVKTLREMGMDVWELEPDEQHPDCAFVGEMAVICGDTALMCRASIDRENEGNLVRSVLKKEFPHIDLVEIKDPDARVYGGDVLFTGQEIFVGISKRTNELGAQYVARVFPDYPCLSVRVDGNRSLKSFVTIGGMRPTTLIAGDSEAAKKIVQRIESDASYRYNIVQVPDDLASCLFANKVLIHKAGYPGAAKTLAEKLRAQKISLDFSEFAKVDGNITSCCLLISKTSYAYRASAEAGR